MTNTHQITWQFFCLQQNIFESLTIRSLPQLNINSLSVDLFIDSVDKNEQEKNTFSAVPSKPDHF